MSKLPKNITFHDSEEEGLLGLSDMEYQSKTFRHRVPGFPRVCGGTCRFALTFPLQFHLLFRLTLLFDNFYLGPLYIVFPCFIIIA